MKPNAVIALSGGIDSTTALYESEKQGMVCKPVFFKYPSKHNAREQVAAQMVAKAAGLDLEEIDLTDVFQAVAASGDSRSALLLGSHENIPEGHYAAESMKKTVVPGRNLIFASVLAAYAESHGLRYVILGVHAGDHAIYPDCRPVFLMFLQDAVRTSSDGRVEVLAPYLNVDKAAIVKTGLALNVPYHLTRTCYSSSGLPCGKCGSCNERLEAFEANGVKDPVKYQQPHDRPADLLEIGGEAGTA
jgi:7-cyano-7-deazaguanine synthase